MCFLLAFMIGEKNLLYITLRKMNFRIFNEGRFLYANLFINLVKLVMFFFFKNFKYTKHLSMQNPSFA